MSEPVSYFPPGRYCKHTETVFVKRTLSNGTKQHGVQCTTCGKWRALKNVAIPITATLVDFNETLHKTFWDSTVTQRLDAWTKEAAERLEARCEEYAEYRKTAKWKAKVARVLARDNYTCQGCLKREATQAHHLTYDHIFDEPLFDLVAICRVCHEAVSKQDGRI
jgi:hypothetical protein